jgi:hypothetical protein
MHKTGKEIVFDRYSKNVVVTGVSCLVELQRAEKTNVESLASISLKKEVTKFNMPIMTNNMVSLNFAPMYAA